MNPKLQSGPRPMKERKMEYTAADRKTTPIISNLSSTKKRKETGYPPALTKSHNESNEDDERGEQLPSHSDEELGQTEMETRVHKSLALKLPEEDEVSPGHQLREQCDSDEEEAARLRTDRVLLLVSFTCLTFGIVMIVAGLLFGLR